MSSKSLECTDISWSGWFWIYSHVVENKLSLYCYYTLSYDCWVKLDKITTKNSPHTMTIKEKLNQRWNTSQQLWYSTTHYMSTQFHIVHHSDLDSTCLTTLYNWGLMSICAVLSLYTYEYMYCTLYILWLCVES